MNQKFHSKTVRLLITLLTCMQTQSLFALAGNITNQTGAAITKAEVTIVADNQNFKALTGSDGKFDIKNLPINKAYSLSVRKSGHTEAIISGNTNDTVLVKLQINPIKYKLKIKVIDRSGAPLTGASVNIGSSSNYLTTETGLLEFDLDHGTQYAIRGSLEDYYFINKPSGNIKGNTQRVLVAELN